MGIFDIFKRTNTPEELYKKKKDLEFIESLKKTSFSISDYGTLTRHGLSEYGARKLLEEGKEPAPNEKVMTASGDLISWQHWKESVSE